MTRPTIAPGPLPLTLLFLGALLPGRALAAAPVAVGAPGAVGAPRARGAWAGETREVSFEGYGGFELSGSLVLPAERKAAGAPALLLLPGSGPTDRDGNQPPGFVTDLLAQVADGLARAGYASLRFDKRAAHVHLAAILKMAPEEQREFLAWEAFVADARAALGVLRATEGVDAGRVGILGHSEGGLIGLWLARELGAGRDGLAALVLAATPGLPLADILRYQVGRNLRALPESMREKYMSELERVMGAVMETGHTPEDADPGLAVLFPENASKLLQVELALDPAELAAGYPGPVLVLQGERDVQVTAEEHPTALEAGFAEREAGSCEVVLVSGASHNFKHVESSDELGMKGEMVPEALDALLGWLARTLPVERAQ